MIAITRPTTTESACGQKGEQKRGLKIRRVMVSSMHFALARLLQKIVNGGLSPGYCLMLAQAMGFACGSQRDSGANEQGDRN